MHEEEAVDPNENESLTYPTESFVAMFVSPTRDSDASRCSA
jgi:hypothetical protein